jgi:poly(3-hydroxybutyrate) depolymerase
MVTFIDSIGSRRGRIIGIAALFAFCLALSHGAYGAESRFVIFRPQVERSYSQEELYEIAREPSLKHETEDGYVANPAVDAFFSEVIYRTTRADGADVDIPFRLHIPFERQSKRQRSLIVVFHGKGEGDEDNARQLAHLHYGIADLVGANGLDAYILATQFPKECSSWYSAENLYGKAPLDYTLEIIEGLVEEYEIPAGRAAAFGICSGATMAREVVEDRPDLFCAQVLCGFSPNWTDMKRPFSVPTWAFNNTDDEGADIELVRATFEAAGKRGDPVWLTEQRSQTHDTWSRALREEHALAWLAANGSTSFAPPPPGCQVVRKRESMEAFLSGLAPILLIASVVGLDVVIARRKKRGTPSS